MQSARNHVARDLIEGHDQTPYQCRRKLEDAELAIDSYHEWLMAAHGIDLPAVLAVTVLADADEPPADPHPAFRLHDEFLAYQRNGGRFSFEVWAARHGDDYDCDGEWLASDYLSVWRRFEDRQDRGEIPADASPPSFAEWLASETDAYRAAHIGADR